MLDSELVVWDSELVVGSGTRLAAVAGTVDKSVEASRSRLQAAFQQRSGNGLESAEITDDFVITTTAGEKPSYSVKTRRTGEAVGSSTPLLAEAIAK